MPFLHITTYAQAPEAGIEQTLLISFDTSREEKNDAIITIEITPEQFADSERLLNSLRAHFDDEIIYEGLFVSRNTDMNGISDQLILKLPADVIGYELAMDNINAVLLSENLINTTISSGSQVSIYEEARKNDQALGGSTYSDAHLFFRNGIVVSRRDPQPVP